MKKKRDSEYTLKYQNPEADGELISDSLEQIEFSDKQAGFQEQLHEAFKAAIEHLCQPDHK